MPVAVGCQYAAGVFTDSLPPVPIAVLFSESRRQCCTVRRQEHNLELAIIDVPERWGEVSQDSQGPPVRRGIAQTVPENALLRDTDYAPRQNLLLEGPAPGVKLAIGSRGEVARLLQGLVN